jgi:hypothetical protein
MYSAFRSTSDSVTEVPKQSQLFHPIGGVGATVRDVEDTIFTPFEEGSRTLKMCERSLLMQS